MEGHCKREILLLVCQYSKEQMYMGCDSAQYFLYMSFLLISIRSLRGNSNILSSPSLSCEHFWGMSMLSSAVDWKSYHKITTRNVESYKMEGWFVYSFQCDQASLLHLLKTWWIITVMCNYNQSVNLIHSWNHHTRQNILSFPCIGCISHHPQQRF